MFHVKHLYVERLGGIELSGRFLFSEAGQLLEQRPGDLLVLPVVEHRVEVAECHHAAPERAAGLSQGNLAAVRASQRGGRWRNGRGPNLRSDRAGRAPPPAGTAPGRPALPRRRTCTRRFRIPTKPSRCSALLGCARSGRFRSLRTRAPSAPHQGARRTAPTLRREPLRTCYHSQIFSHDPLRSR